MSTITSTGGWVPRNQLPQIKRADHPEFLQFLVGKGISHSTTALPASSLAPTQQAIDQSKIQTLLSIPNNLIKPILVSDDHYILDGHHTHAALLSMGPLTSVPVHIIHTSIHKLIALGHEFPKSAIKSMNEATSTDKTAVLAYGRLNPPSIGHAKLVDKLKSVAQELGGDAELVVSHSQDAKKNPLSSAQKLKHLHRYFPDIEITASSKDEPTPISAARRLNRAGYQHLIFVAGSDRTHEFTQLLNKYNGKEYTFKTIKVISAGNRDPDAEGTEGMSASKMRQAAKEKNFPEFCKGVPDYISDRQAKELYQDVRMGMHLQESAQMMMEGAHDAAIFKAVFLAGGPGSGKDFILKRTLDGHGLVEINSDKALEFLMDKEALNKKMPEGEQEKREGVRKRAKSMTELRQRLAIEGRNGLIINGTADDPEKILHIKQSLEDLGYTSSMVFVDTSDEVSKLRNIARGERGGRRVPDTIRQEKWKKSQDARSEFESSFGDNFISFDNSEDLTDAKVDPQLKKSKEDELQKIFKKIRIFTEQGSEDPAAQAWITDQLGKRSEHSHVQKQFGLKQVTGSGTSVENSDIGKQAQALGLQYYGFGRYGKKGSVTHKVHEGQLHPVTPIPSPGSSSGAGVPRSVKESYAPSITEEPSETVIDQLARKHGVSIESLMAQIEMGIEVETEHTPDYDIALQIALDHLKERPDYYTKLKAMEQSPKRSLSDIKKKMSETTFGYDETTPQQWGPGKDEWHGGQAGIAGNRKIFLLKKTS